MFSMCQLWSPSGVSLPQNLKYVWLCAHFTLQLVLSYVCSIYYLLFWSQEVVYLSRFFFHLELKLNAAVKQAGPTRTRIQNLVNVLLKLFCESYIIITSMNEFHDLINREWCWLRLPHIPEDVWEKCSNLFPVWFCEVKKYGRALKAFWRSR